MNNCKKIIYFLAEVLMQKDIHKEDFSYAYIHAVASAAKCSVQRATIPMDHEGIDLTITHIGKVGTKAYPRFDAQVKCTSQDVIKKDFIKFSLEVNAYEKLISDCYSVPQILIVVVVPKNSTEWVIQSEAELVMKHCGYWKYLKGNPPTANKESITVSLPRENIFSTDALGKLMARISLGEIT